MLRRSTRLTTRGRTATSTLQMRARNAKQGCRSTFFGDVERVHTSTSGLYNLPVDISLRCLLVILGIQDLLILLKVDKYTNAIVTPVFLSRMVCPWGKVRSWTQYKRNMVRKIKGYSMTRREQLRRLPRDLVELDMYYRFRSTPADDFPPGLKHLTLCNRTNGPIRSNFPETLKSLTLDSSLHPVTKLPANLKSLTVEYGYEPPLPPGLLPTGLLELKITYPDYSHPLGQGVLPAGLLRLQVPKFYNHTVVRPAGLTVVRGPM